MIGQRAFVGLGANLGDAAATVLAAVQALGGLPQTSLAACSALYKSAPRDASGPDYINAVAELHTTLAPLVLLHHLQTIEGQQGRTRPFHHAPRTLDLDLLLYGDVLLNTPQLSLPHPRLHLRAFVLRPLAELSPQLMVPGLGQIGPWLMAVADQRVEVLRP